MQFDCMQVTRLTAIGRTELPVKIEVVSTQCVGTSPPAPFRNCSVAQPLSLHGRLPWFQIASEIPMVPAPPPLSPGQYAICSWAPVHVGSLAVTTTATGGAVDIGVGVALGTAVGTIDVGDGEGVLLPGELVGGSGAGVLLQDASATVRAVAAHPVLSLPSLTTRSPHSC
jgi:hypothetical protein